ncbi:MAG: beta-ketoacyl synthase N-terminal-like domain-containing protein, partial [Smithellaceae bacterium]
MTTKLENSSMPVIAASYLGPALIPNADAAWDEAKLPANADDLVQKIMGQPMRRAGRFIKLVCCGALSCMQGAPKEVLQGKRTGIFLSTGLGNIDEILPFITQVFKHDGGFPSPNQFANSVSNAAAFFLAKACDVKGTVITVSQEELSFESALWLAQSYLDAGEIELALVGGCDVFTPAVEDYRERLNLVPGRYRRAPLGEGSSWFLLGGDGEAKVGDILSVEISSGLADAESLSSDDLLDNCEKLFEEFQHNMKPSDNGSKLLLPGFRLFSIDEASWKKNGWDIDDYLPHCGISSTASAYGLARG